MKSSVVSKVVDEIFQTNHMSLTVITVTYHSVKTVQSTIMRNAEILGSYAGELEWIIIDNSENSSDSEFLSAQTLPSNIKVVPRPDNPGFAAGCNFGAHLSQADWIMLINPDLALEPDKFRRVMNHLKSQSECTTQTFAVGQITDGRDHLGITLRWSVWFSDRLMPTDSFLLGPSGGIGVFPRVLFLDAGGLDEAMFAWGEDAELAIRLHQQGVPCMPIDVYFEHSGGHVHQHNPNILKRKTWLLARNRQLVAKRHFRFGTRLRFLTLAILVGAVKSPSRVKDQTFVPWLLGNFDGLRGHKGVSRY